MDWKTFSERKSGENCPMCRSVQTDDVVAELSSGRVHLQNDADFRGYCILVCKRHVVELFELSAEERAQWMEDVTHIACAIELLCHPAKLNVAMLGNQMPHLHCHIIPRYPDDPKWGGPAFLSDAERRPLIPEDFQELQRALHQKLNHP